MPETGQSEWNAQALVAAGAVLLLLTALWLGVYAPGQKKLSDDFETTYEYGGELKVLDIPQFQTMQDADNDGCSCTVYSNAIARHVLVAESGQSSDDETFFNENFSVFANDKTVDQDKDGLSDSYLFTLKDGNSWLDRVTYESRGEGSEADDYGYSTWNPNHPPTGDENFQFPNPFVGTHTNTYVYQPGGDTEIDGVSAYIYVADETLTPIPYTPSSSNPLYGLMALGATFHISYHETVTVDATHGTALDRVFDVKVYANFPNYFAEGGLLYLTDGVHFPSETSYSGSLFDAANSLDVNVTAVKTTSVGPENTTTATHLLTNTAFAVNTDMVVGVDDDGNPIVVTIDLNADGSLVAPAPMFVDRSTHQVGDNANGTSFGDTFPHMNTNVSAAAFFPNPFDSNYNNMYSPVGVNATTGIAHFRGVPIGVAGIDGNGTPILAPVQIPRGTLYVYAVLDENGTQIGMQPTTDPIPNSMMFPNGSFAGPVMTADILMDYTEDIYFDPSTGTVQNQVYSVTGYIDADGSGNLTAMDEAMLSTVGATAIVQTLNVEYTDEQKAAYPVSMGQKAFAMYYSGKSIPVMTLDGGFTPDEQAAGVESANERISGLKLLDTYVPGLLIVLALGCLIGGFYLYYQEGEGGGGVAAPPAPEPEADDGGDDDTGDSADDDSGGDDADDGGDSDD